MAPTTILLVEDDPNDVFMVETLFQTSAPDVRLITVPDAEQAQAYLEGRHPYEDRDAHPFPDLILLDLNLPRLTGHEFLEWLRAHGEHDALPVFVLSSSQDPDDVQRAYAGGANGYLRKVADVSALESIVKGVASYVSLRRARAGRDGE